jgi:hypothetical protein
MPSVIAAVWGFSHWSVLLGLAMVLGVGQWKNAPEGA